MSEGGSVSPVCLHLWITGRVQGVWYRRSTQQEARSLGLVGWVRNLRDGRVELVAQGDAGQVELLRAWCAEGPPKARVDAIELREEAVKDEGWVDFSVRPTL